MSIVASIKNFIKDLPDDRIFTTRDLIHLTTSRSSIDVTMHRMVYMKEIIRLARGVFMKNIPAQRMPSVEEVAVVKAKSFGKEIYQHGINAAAEIGLIERKYYQRSRYLFYTNGCTSAFNAGQFRVRLKAVSKRKANISQSEAGKLLKAIWQLGKEKAGKMRNKTMKLAKSLNKLERLDFRKEIKIMPGWMVQIFYPKIIAKKSAVP